MNGAAAFMDLGWGSENILCRAKCCDSVAQGDTGDIDDEREMERQVSDGCVVEEEE